MTRWGLSITIYWVLNPLDGLIAEVKARRAVQQVYKRQHSLGPRSYFLVFHGYWTLAFLLDLDKSMWSQRIHLSPGMQLYTLTGLLYRSVVRISLVLYIVGQTVSSTHRVILFDHLNEKHSDIQSQILSLALTITFPQVLYTWFCLPWAQSVPLL